MLVLNMIFKDGLNVGVTAIFNVETGYEKSIKE